MTFLIIALGVALVASLAFNFGLVGGGAKPAPSSASSSTQASSPRANRDDDADTRASKAEAELEKKRKELEEVKMAQSALKEELKNAKKKLHDQKESAKSGDDLVKARAEVERQASLQLETTRMELAAAHAENQRLKTEMEGRGRRQQQPAPAPKAPESTDAVVAAKPEEKPQVVVQRVIRELSEGEKEKMQRLEQQAASDKKKAIEIAAELRNVKSKVDREKREAKRIYEEGRLARDKFRAVETRLNRTLTENDLLKRAIADLERKTGMHAEHTTPTPEELAASDAKVSAQHAAEDKAADEAHRKLEAAEAAAAEASVSAETNGATAVAAVTPAPETTAPVATPNA